MEAYLEGTEPSVEKLRELIRKGTLAIDFIPILCGSSFKNKGVQPMLNAVIDYLPTPLDVPAYMGFAPGDESETRNIARSADDAQPFSALAFKIMNDPFVGSLTFTRIYSGQLKKGDQMINSTKERRERVGDVLRRHVVRDGGRARRQRAERVRWDRLCPMLCECGVMTVAEIDMLVRYCTMAAQFDECQAALQKQFDFKTANHQLKLADRLLAVERQLGLTPASRTGIIVGKPADDRNAIELALFG
jgi:hypothetical protein